MTVNIRGVPLQPLLIGQGAKNSALAMADCTPLQKPPTQVTLPIDWSTYGASSINPVLINISLDGIGSTNPIEAIRSCYIDNSGSPTTVYVIAPDTQFVVQCAPYSVVLAPIWTNGKVLNLFAQNFSDNAIPTTTFQFSNSHVNSYYQASATPATKLKNIIASQLQYNVGGTVVQTFNNIPLGSAAPSRKIVYVVTAEAAAANMTLNSVSSTSGNANILVKQLSTNLLQSTAILIDTQPFAALGQLQLTFAGAPLGVVLRAYTLYNLEFGGVPFSFVSSNAAPMNLVCPQSGFAIAGIAGTSSNDFLTGISNSGVQLIGGGPNTIIDFAAYQPTNGSGLIIQDQIGGSAAYLAQVCASFQ